MNVPAKENLVDWLRDAHAMEKQALTMMEAQHERLEHYPSLKTRLAQHIEETRGQLDQLNGCLERLGESSSVLKDTTARVTAFAQGLGGMFMGDEVVKGGMASYTFENFEIATYRALIAASDYVKDSMTADVCRRILEQEEAMAGWLEDHLPEITQEYLRRNDQDMTAKR